MARDDGTTGRPVVEATDEDAPSPAITVLDLDASHLIATRLARLGGVDRRFELRVPRSSLPDDALTAVRDLAIRFEQDGAALLEHLGGFEGAELDELSPDGDRR